jgi:hypothetical protein
VPGDHWAVVMDVTDEFEGMIYTRFNGRWSSYYAPIGFNDEYQLAGEEDVPEDMPADFWPLAARTKLGAE